MSGLCVCVCAGSPVPEKCYLYVLDLCFSLGDDVLHLHSSLHWIFQIPMRPILYDSSGSLWFLPLDRCQVSSWPGIDHRIEYGYPGTRWKMIQLLLFCRTVAHLERRDCFSTCLPCAFHGERTIPGSRPFVSLTSVGVHQRIQDGLD